MANGSKAAMKASALSKAPSHRTVCSLAGAPFVFRVPWDSSRTDQVGIPSKSCAIVSRVISRDKMFDRASVSA